MEPLLNSRKFEARRRGIHLKLKRIFRKINHLSQSKLNHYVVCKTMIAPWQLVPGTVAGDSKRMIEKMAGRQSHIQRKREFVRS